MNKNKILLIICLLPIRLLAQEQWTLKQCIDYGLKNNRSTAVYENEWLAARAKANEALSDYLPKVSVSGTFDDNLKVQKSIIPAGVFGPDPITVAFTQKYNTNGVAQIDQTIYDQSLLTGLKANKFNRQQAILAIQQNQESIIYNISSAYYQIYVYRENLQLDKENIETFRKQMEVLQLQVKNGVTLQKDLDKVTVKYNNAVSQLRVAQSNVNLAENQLKYNMGYPLKDSLPLVITLGINAGTPIYGNADRNEFAASNRTDYKISEINAKLLDIEQHRVKAEAFPKLSGYARYGAVGFGSTLGPAFTDLNPYSAIGLKITIPLFDFFKRNAQVSQAKYKSINAQQNLKIDEGKYRLEYENAKTSLVKAEANVKSDKRNIELAEIVFKTTDLQFRKGVTDLTEWLDARNSIKDAQVNYLNSLNTFYQAHLDLERTAGSLQKFYSTL